MLAHLAPDDVAGAETNDRDEHDDTGRYDPRHERGVEEGFFSGG